MTRPILIAQISDLHIKALGAGSGFGNVVTHTVPIGDFDDPHPFFGADGKLL